MADNTAFAFLLQQTERVLLIGTNGTCFMEGNMLHGGEHVSWNMLHEGEHASWNMLHGGEHASWRGTCFMEHDS